MDTFKKLYTKADASLWEGRIDGEERELQRWHQVVTYVDLNERQSLENTIVLLGFCCDEGVRRNQGREGAKATPDYLRKVLANLPVHFSDKIVVVDAGNIHSHGYDLESAQQALTIAVQKIKSFNGFPLLIGGGHEITYGHFKGLHQPNRKLGIINIDAHLDMRPLTDGKGNSGTGFYQINEDLMEAGGDFNYLAFGIQEIANTKGLLQSAESSGVNIIYGSELFPNNIEHIKSKIQDFVNGVDDIYLTVDMDAFAAAFAPGVSAVAMNGIIPEHTFYSLLSYIYQQPKLISMDIAELNPRFDIDERTARLAAHLIFQCLQKF
ncbi:formimidoylglutamase [Sphingobacterium bovistauri]|uniref:Formimidoylglutamase n=1 Tax=Sphingobacterium bovistauri TaxID=2781959 RepID=A0ABS7Z5T7_9SPHI|nr:formimidoylglutamase [Sphingobacterium bovistauri]MCA5005565.1 formimidoylglutamase [Sphingobacterium bovistauri]